MTIDQHPHEHVNCSECGAGAGAWQKKRRLPQIGQTYECENCGHEVYVYDAGGPGETVRQWRRVSDSMVVNLRFFDEVGDWPDSVCEDLFRRGVERAQAIDYHVVEREGLSQSEWARRVGKTQQTVSTNVGKAKATLGENDGRQR
ncbi:MAG: hypothetical protein ACLFNI_11425 [Natronomonas sp.]